MFKRIKTILFTLYCLSYFVCLGIYLDHMQEIPAWVILAITSAYNIPIWYEESKRDYITSKLQQRLLILTPIVGLLASIIYGLVSIFLLK